jgi:hypothetical protein
VSPDGHGGVSAMGPGTQTLTIIAQDPTVRAADDRILRAQAVVPAEELAAGPWGHRVQVIDYDRTRDLLYPPLSYEVTASGTLVDPYADAADEVLLGDPRFHAQNVFAIAMRTLARFEQALGRRVNWGFGEAHQLKLVPHAFTDANAFYSRADEALLFGCFPSRAAGQTVFTCLSHDVVAHEVTHALLDGIRTRFMSPSSPDQAAFHEAFADLVAILSVFSLPGVVEAVLTRRGRGDPGAARLAISHEPVGRGRRPGRAGERARGPRNGADMAPAAPIDEHWLIDSVLLGLAEQMGGEIDSSRVNALRRSASLVPDTGYLQRPEFLPAHRRGEVLVAAVLRALVDIWIDRLRGVARGAAGELDRARVAEEGELIADQLLTMAIRALDYTPPVHLEFGDFLSALLTADAQVRPDDARYRFRDHLRSSFERYGITPASQRHVPTLSATQATLRSELRAPVSAPGGVGPAQTTSVEALTTAEAVASPQAEALAAPVAEAAGLGGSHREARAGRTAATAARVASGSPIGTIEDGLWVPCGELALRYHRTHYEPLGREPDEVYRFLWENRVALQLYEGALTRVISVRPCLRVGPDGFILRETVAEFFQIVRLTPDELRQLDVVVPASMPADAIVALAGGGTLIFDEFGRLQYYIHNSLDNGRRQSERLAHLWAFSRLGADFDVQQDFARIHRLRSLDSDRDPREEW